MRKRCVEARRVLGEEEGGTYPRWTNASWPGLHVFTCHLDVCDLGRFIKHLLSTNYVLGAMIVTGDIALMATHERPLASQSGQQRPGADRAEVGVGIEDSGVPDHTGSKVRSSQGALSWDCSLGAGDRGHLPGYHGSSQLGQL